MIAEKPLKTTEWPYRSKCGKVEQKDSNTYIHLSTLTKLFMLRYRLILLLLCAGLVTSAGGGCVAVIVFGFLLAPKVKRGWLIR